MEEHDPQLKAAFLDLVEEQLAHDDPPEVRQAFERLKKEGNSEEDARLYVAQAACTEVWDIIRNGNAFNLERYIRNLKNLPEEPSEESL